MLGETFYGKPRTRIISCNSLTNAINKMDTVNFYNKLSLLVRCIPIHNVLILGRDTNAQIGKEENRKFCIYNASNRNEEHLTILI